MSRTVTHVDANGNVLGEVDLLAAHTGDGTLHRAFSVFVFTPDRSELLIQRRAKGKMLWPLIWANTCCSHPYPNETAIDAGTRRLQEELGFMCELKEGPCFTYLALDPNGRGVEHEYDQILIGFTEENTVIKPNPDEVDEWKWIDLRSLRADMTENLDHYAPWFHIGLKKLAE
jgi:isopentenyl-diphosphate Delta-isomerase